MDTKVSASGPGTSCTLSKITKTYKDSLQASVKKITTFTVKEAYDYVGDLMNMIKHVADNESPKKDTKTYFVRGVTSLYNETLTNMRANKKASKLKYNTLKTDTLSRDTNQGKCTSLKAYDTLRDPREPKANRSKSVGGF